MSDTISRQAVIDALCKSECGCGNAECRHKDDTDFCVTCDNIKIIKFLPSAHPEVIRCKDCIYQTESWSGIKYCEAHGDHIGKDYDYCSNARRKTNGIL